MAASKGLRSEEMVLADWVQQHKASKDKVRSKCKEKKERVAAARRNEERVSRLSKGKEVLIDSEEDINEGAHWNKVQAFTSSTYEESGSTVPSKISSSDKMSIVHGLADMGGINFREEAEGDAIRAEQSQVRTEDFNLRNNEFLVNGHITCPSCSISIVPQSPIGSSSQPKIKAPKKPLQGAISVNQPKEGAIESLQVSSED